MLPLMPAVLAGHDQMNCWQHCNTTCYCLHPQTNHCRSCTQLGLANSFIIYRYDVDHCIALATASTSCLHVIQCMHVMSKYVICLGIDLRFDVVHHALIPTGRNQSSRTTPQLIWESFGCSRAAETQLGS